MIPDVMDDEWLSQANAAVDVALSSDGYNEFNSGGIGVTSLLQHCYQRQSLKAVQLHNY